MPSTKLSPDSAQPDELVGSQIPRIWTPRDPDRASLGPLMARTAEIGGIDFDPWQHLVADCGLEIDDHGRWIHRGVCLLVARQNGKTVLLEARILAGLFAFSDERLILHTAQDRAVPRELFQSLVERIHATPEFRRRIPKRGIREANGQERITTVDGSSYRILAPRPAAFRTWSADLLIFDEAREQHDTGMWGAALPTQRARPNPQWWAVSNAGGPDSVVLNGLVERGRRAADNPGADPKICYLEWSAAGGMDRDLDDEAAWAEANPSLGIRLTAETIREELAALDPDAFRTEVLCQSVPTATAAAIPPAAWLHCGGHDSEISQVLPRPVLGIDIDGSRTHAAAVMAVVRDGRLVADIVQEWRDPDGVDQTEIAADLRMWMKAYRVKDLGYDVRAAGHVAQLLDRQGTRVHQMSTTQFVVAAANLFDAVTTGYLWHRNNPDLDAQIAVAARKDTGDDAWYISRSASPDSISAVIALAFAVHLAYRPTAPPRIH